MMLENLLTNLAPAEVAAALSCITFEQKNLPDVKFNDNLESLKLKLIIFFANFFAKPNLTLKLKIQFSIFSQKICKTFAKFS